MSPNVFESWEDQESVPHFTEPNPTAVMSTAVWLKTVTETAMSETVPDGFDHAEAHLHTAVGMVQSGLR